MKYIVMLSAVMLLLSSCNDGSDVEIYNENNTTVKNGIVYDIDEKPINGLYKIYYPNGNVRMEIESKDGYPQGIGKFYDEDGVLTYSAHFEKGVLNGVLLNYYADGHIHNELNYLDGALEGEQKTFNEAGEQIIYAVFSHGKAVSGYTTSDGKRYELTTEELQGLE